MTKTASEVIADRLRTIRENGWHRDYRSDHYADDVLNDLDAAGFVIVPREPAEATDWQPVETAPEDGEPILCARGNSRFIARWWTAEGGWSLDLGGDDECLVLRTENAPTHWMPLPEPPQAR